jgi:hypothetical protein
VKIFVQLASYRDPQLIPTIEDMLDKADNKDLFNFGICWQYDEEENPDYYKGKKNFRVKKYHFSESEGLGWARNITNTLYDGEELTLQLDSHHRFERGWDTAMLEDYEQAKTFCKKPIITTYCTPWEPDKNVFNPVPCLMHQYEFSQDKLLMSMPYYIQDYKKRKKVIRSRTISGHFYLVDGKFIEEVPYDPDIYFGGYVEEVTLSVRAYTHGYDFWSPYRQLIWHEYTRNYRRKHWDDHGKNEHGKKASFERDIFARNKTRQLFGQEQHDIEIDPNYGLGTTRTFQEYEQFGGFDFKKCRIQKYTLACKEPPNPLSWDDDNIKYQYKKSVKIDLNKINKNNKLKFIALGILSKFNQEIIRKDFFELDAPEVFKRNSDVLELEFDSEDPPSKWVMHPFYEDSNTWGERQEGNIA